MGRYTRLVDSRWRSTPILDGPASAGYSKSSSALDALGAVKEYMDTLSSIKNVGDGIEMMRMLDEVGKALGPKQEVRVIINKKENSIIGIQRPGHGMLLPTTDEIYVEGLIGDDEGLCHVNPRETTQFTIHTREGIKKYKLDDGLRPLREMDEPEEDTNFDEYDSESGPQFKRGLN